MELEQHSKGNSVMGLLWHKGHLLAHSSPIAPEQRRMELQRDRTCLSRKAKMGCTAREQEQREKEHRQSAETSLRNGVREATQT